MLTMIITVSSSLPDRHLISSCTTGAFAVFRSGSVCVDEIADSLSWRNQIFKNDDLSLVAVDSGSGRRTVVRFSKLVLKYRLRYCIRTDALYREFVIHRFDDSSFY